MIIMYPGYEDPSDLYYAELRTKTLSRLSKAPQSIKNLVADGLVWKIVASPQTTALNLFDTDDTTVLSHYSRDNNIYVPDLRKFITITNVRKSKVFLDGFDDRAMFSCYVRHDALGCLSLMNYLIYIWASVMASISPYTPQDRLERIARVVIDTTPNTEEQAILLTVSFYENTFGARGIPFGATGRHAAIEQIRRQTRRSPMTEHEAANSVLNIVRRARRQCPRASVAARLGYFHHGRGCQSDSYSSRESRTVHKLLRRVQGLIDGVSLPVCSG